MHFFVFLYTLPISCRAGVIWACLCGFNHHCIVRILAPDRGLANFALFRCCQSSSKRFFGAGLGQPVETGSLASSYMHFWVLCTLYPYHRRFCRPKLAGAALRVREAPQPSDLLWENQDTPWWSRLLRRMRPRETGRVVTSHLNSVSGFSLCI